MASRVNLHNQLLSIAGNNKVYYQAPSRLEYPCILYEKTGYKEAKADNRLYKNLTHYTITCIGTNPDNDSLIDSLRMIPYCTFNRRYVNDNLYHDVLDLYY